MAPNAFHAFQRARWYTWREASRVTGSLKLLRSGEASPQEAATPDD